jgi:ribosomal protein S18 acetylase RimI-like enzyme
VLRNINLIELDTANQNHLITMYSVRTHSQVVPFLRGAPPPDFSSHVHYFRSLGPHKKFFLVQSESSLCGYCQLTFADTHVEIGMALHPDFCNQGIGSIALSQLLKVLFQNDKAQNKSIILFVKKDNFRAIALYSKSGFKRVGNENEYGEYLMEFTY